MDESYTLKHNDGLTLGNRISAGTLVLALIARFMGLTWGPPGDDRTHVDHMLAAWTLLSGWCDRATNRSNTDTLLDSKWLIFPMGPFYSYGLTLIPTRICNHIDYKVWDEITHPLPNFNGATFEGWEWISNFIPHYVMDVISYSCWD